MAGAVLSHGACRPPSSVPEDDEWTFLPHCSAPPPQRPEVRLGDEDLFPLAPGHPEYFAGGLVTAAPDGLTVRRRTLRLGAGPHRLRTTARGGTAGQPFRQRRGTGATPRPGRSGRRRATSASPCARDRSAGRPEAADERDCGGTRATK
ncbi:hypothetical protein [Streptomyces ziwulingensis]|uniref:Uncharacterized protein n=1 Tax=Streptomyces ziwulingensis TaxID=1045501 RepID=A0ABP9CRA4_9ACTN